jgi:gamma-glutamyltranspeptidase
MPTSTLARSDAAPTPHPNATAGPGSSSSSNRSPLLTREGKAPAAGEMFRNLDLATTLRRLGELGAKEGRRAAACRL